MGDSRHDELPADIRLLIDQQIRSVGHLETLLYLFEHRDRDWSALELSRELRTNQSYAESQLAELGALVEKREPQYRLKSDEALLTVTQKLSDLYRERRHAIINYIYAKPPDALRSFADAFRFNKD